MAGRFAYATNFVDSTVSIYAVEGASGRLVPWGYSQTGPYPLAMVVDGNGAVAYVLHWGDGTVGAYLIGPLGALTSMMAPLPVETPLALTLHPSGRFCYVVNFGPSTISIFAIALDGSLMQVGAPVPVGTFPRWIGFAPSGLFAYVVSGNAGIVSTLSVDPGTGLLSPIGAPLSAGAEPQSAVIDSAGRHLYVANSGSNTVSGFRIDPATGALTALGPPVATGTAPVWMAVHPSGNAVYLADLQSNSITTLGVDATTGMLTEIGPPLSTGLHPAALTLNAEGSFLYVLNYDDSTVTSYAVDGATGALSALPAQTTVTRAAPSCIVLTASAAFDFTPRFAFSADQTSGEVSAFVVDASTGALASAGPATPGGQEPESIAAHPARPFVYVASHGDGTALAFKIDTTTGRLGPAGAPVVLGVAAGGPTAVAVHPGGQFAYFGNDDQTFAVAETISILAIDGATGGLTLSGSVPTGSGGLIDLTIEPGGRFLYVANGLGGNVGAFSIDTSTGALTSIGNFDVHFAPVALSVDPSGQFLYVAYSDTQSGIAAYRIDVGTGALTPLGGVIASSGPWSVNNVAVDPMGRLVLLVSGVQASHFPGLVTAYPIDPQTGAVGAAASSASAGTQAYALAIDRMGRFFYVGDFGSPVDNNASYILTFTLDGASGTVAGTTLSVPSGHGTASLTITTAASS
jgi:YVTN family beta-propeller protein